MGICGCGLTCGQPFTAIGGSENRQRWKIIATPVIAQIQLSEEVATTDSELAVAGTDFQQHVVRSTIDAKTLGT